MPHSRQKYVSLTLMLLAISACTELADGVQKMGENTKVMVADTKESWSDLLTYQPKRAPQLPQTRYCYHTLSDVVCYDSVQPTLTSHLDGYQDGENISWVQPGGGSLGVSGGTPTAAANAEHAQVAPNAAATVADASAVSSSSEITSAPVAPPVASAANEKITASASNAPTSDTPFYRKESPYQKPDAN